MLNVLAGRLVFLKDILVYLDGASARVTMAAGRMVVNHSSVKRVLKQETQAWNIDLPD